MSDVSDQRRYYERMMDEIATAHRDELDRLEAENAKLRDAYGERQKEHMQLTVEYSDALDENDRIRAENAKLREFASEAFSMAFNFYHGAGTAEDLRELRAEYRELGIEVDA